MAFLKNTALIATLLAALVGCGTPGSTVSPLTGEATQQAQTSAKFSENSYATATVKQLESISCGAEGDECTGAGPERRAHAGKKYKVTGSFRFRQIFNDKVLNFTYTASINDWLHVYRKAYLTKGSAERFREKIGAGGLNDDPGPTVTVYLTVLPPGEFPGFRLDAVKRADGKLVTL
jgi:hypothetical protein